MKTNPRLFSAISAFQIDRGDPEFRFVHRLARENAWDSAFAERVLQEYRRFVYLACVTEKNAVTPSVAVDQAWHLHLCYTRSYWTDLCERVLGRPLHHGPTEGGQAEDQRYRAQYEHTLQLYAHEFGERPPADIWPAPDIRFAATANPFWVSRNRFVIVEKTSLRKAALLTGLFSAGALGAGAASTGSGVVWVFAFVAAVLVVLVWKISRRGNGGPGSCGSSCGSSGDSSSHSGCGGDSGCGGGCGGD